MTIEANATRTGTAVASLSVRAMSSQLRAVLYRQLVAKTPRYGVNVRIEVPAGEEANELRKASVDLMNSGLMLHPTGHTVPLSSLQRELKVVLHYTLVDALLKHEDASRYVDREVRKRMQRLDKMLHYLVLSSVSSTNARSMYELEIKDAVSVSDIGVSMHQLYGSYREQIADYELHKEALRIIRYMIAPYNEEHAEIRVVFRRSEPSNLSFEVNGKPVMR